MNFVEIGIVEIGILVIGLALLIPLLAGFWRLVVGPTALDRLIGFDTLTVTSVAYVLVFSWATHSNDFIEFVIVLSSLSFLTTVAYFYYLMQLSPGDDEFKESP